MKTKKGFIDFFNSTKEQKKNQKLLIYEFIVILGAIFIGEGVMSLFPSNIDKGYLLSIGLIMVIFAVLSYRYK